MENRYNKASSSQSETPSFYCASLATLLIMRRVSRPRLPPPHFCLRPRGVTHYSSSIQTDRPCLAASQSARPPGSAENKLLSDILENLAQPVFFSSRHLHFRCFQELLVVSGGSTATVTPSAALLPYFSFISLDQVSIELLYIFL